MKSSSRPRCALRLSPNELQSLVKQERDKWRIFRIQQVREQAKQEAHRIREAVRFREAEMIEQLTREVVEKWEAEKESKVRQLEKEYQDCLKNIGAAHRLAAQQPDPHQVLQQRERHNRRLALRRGQEADRQRVEEMRQQQHLKNAPLRQRQEALHSERLRAKHVANLPVPEAFKKKPEVEEKPKQKVALHEAGTFTTTHYVPQNVKVEKEIWSSKPNAREVAAAEEAERERLETERRRQAEEEDQRREQRGRDALRKVHLTRLLQQLTEGLDEAQRQHQLSMFMDGRDRSIIDKKEGFPKDPSKQERQIEKAVERLLQKEKQEREEEKEESTIPDSYQLSSEYLEELETSEDNGLEAATGTKIRGVRSLLQEVERRRRRILEDLGDVVPVRGPSDRGSDGSPEDRTESVHLAETIPVHLHPGYPPARSSRESPAAGKSPPPSSSSSSLSQPHTKESTVEHRESSSTVLPLSEESLPLSIESTQPSLSSLTPHSSVISGEPTDTHVPLPKPATPHTTSSDISTSLSSDIKITVDLDVGSSTLVESESTNGEEELQVTESQISSTDYYSPPSELPRRQVSLQEIEDNLKVIQENRQRNWDILNHLSWKRGSPDSHYPATTYIERLKEEGSGKKPLKRKEKFDLQKRALIQHYIQKLLQRRDSEGDLSASTVEGSGLSVSSLGSLLSYLEGEGEEGETTGSPSSTNSVVTTSSSTASRSPSEYHDIDEFPVKMKSKEHERLPSHAITSSAIYSAHTDSYYTATSPSTSTTLFSSYSSSYPSPYSSSISSISSQLKEPLSSSSSSASTSSSHHAMNSRTHPFVSFTSGQRQEVTNNKSGRTRKHRVPPFSYLTPITEHEPAIKGLEVTSGLDTTTTTASEQDTRVKWYATQRRTFTAQHEADITTSSSSDLSERASSRPPATQSSEDTNRVSTTSIIPGSGTKMEYSEYYETAKTALPSELSGTRQSYYQSAEEQQSPVCLPTIPSAPVTSTTTATMPTTSQPSHSSGESSSSMPDMRQVLRRFGIVSPSRKSSSSTSSSEGDEQT